MRKADTPKTVYVHGAGEITMMQSWDDLPRMYVWSMAKTTVLNWSRLTGSRRTGSVSNVTLLVQWWLRPSHNTRCRPIKSADCRLAWGIATTIARITLCKNINETLIKSCRWTAMWDPSTSLKNMEYMHVNRADTIRLPLCYMCPGQALTPSSNNAYHADTSTELIILFDTQDEAKISHKKVFDNHPLTCTNLNTKNTVSPIGSYFTTSDLRQHQSL